MSQYGPTLPFSCTGGIGWSNRDNLLLDDGNNASISAMGLTNEINFNFADVPALGEATGLLVEVDVTTTGGECVVDLVVDGVGYRVEKPCAGALLEFGSVANLTEWETAGLPVPFDLADFDRVELRFDGGSGASFGADFGRLTIVYDEPEGESTPAAGRSRMVARRVRRRLIRRRVERKASN